MNTCTTYLLPITLVCLTGAMVLATGGEAASLTEQGVLPREGSLQTVSSFEERGTPVIAGLERPASIDRSGTAHAWSEIAEDAWPARDFSDLLDVLPALYGIREAYTLSDSVKRSDSSSRMSLPAPSIDASHSLPDRRDQSTQTLRPPYALTAAELREQLQQPRPPRLVDLRRQEDFAHFRLAGSLNIPRAVLKTKGFLKHRPFVLLDEGYEPHAMETLCEELRQAGFEARFLYGGLTAWKASGADLDGDRFAQHALVRMPVSAFRNGLTDERRLIVALDNALSRSDVPQAVTLPYHGDPQTWLRRLEDTLAHRTGQPDLWSVVIVSRFGDAYRDLEPALRASRVPNVFLLEGGWQAYRDLLSREIVAREPGSASTDAPIGCPNCQLSCQ